MTTTFEEEVTCGVCGHKQTVTELGSTNSFGSMDLDTRPPDMQRSTMDMWVHECEESGDVGCHSVAEVESAAAQLPCVTVRAISAGAG